MAPTFVFPNTSAGGQFAPAIGSVYFYAAVDPHWHDPYSLQQDLSIDHDFGRNFGGRISYIGMHTWHQVWQPQFNQLARSSTRQASAAAATDYPFPNFYQITRRSPGATADYQSLQLELTRRLIAWLRAGFRAYTLAKNLSDNQGTNGNYSSSAGFVDEQGGYNPTDSTNAAVDYGNVAGTRHQRWLTTVIFELPYGRGKHIRREQQPHDQRTSGRLAAQQHLPGAERPVAYGILSRGGHRPVRHRLRHIRGRRQPAA